MYVIKTKESYISNLLEDKNFAITYLSAKDPHEFTNKRLIELQKELKKAKAKYDKTNLCLQLTTFFKIKGITNKRILQINDEQKILKRCVNNIEVFESNLAALLILNIIDFKGLKD